MKHILALMGLFMSPVLWAQSYTISTFAGAALPILPAPAVSIPIGFSTGVAVDSAGNAYVSDSQTGVVFKISMGGTATQFAGTGRPGYSGDGGPAIAAQLNSPEGLALDTSGNLYIADAQNSRIRKVSTLGTITTVAGNGNFGYGGDGGPATQATLFAPMGVAVDGSGNIYIADSSNHAIREVSTAGVISTIAGNGTYGYTGDGGSATAAEISTPLDVAVDTSGNIFIADLNNYVVRKVSGGIISTFAGNGTAGYSGDGGPAIYAQLSEPYAIAADAGGNIYVADALNQVIRKVSAGGTITTVAGSGSSGFSGDGGAATSAELADPQGVAIGPGGSFYIADSLNLRVREVSSSGTITTIAGNGWSNYAGDNIPAIKALLDYPGGVAVGSNGDVYIADTYNQRIRQVSSNGLITTIAGNGIEGSLGDNGPAAAAELADPERIATDASGNIYIATEDSRVRRVSSTGSITTFAGGMGFGYSGDGGPAISAELSQPYGIAVDSNGNVYIADSSNQVIRKVAPDGIITTFAGNGNHGYLGDGGPATSATLNSPEGVAADGSGNLYIADTENAVIRKVDNQGVITTVAGDGTSGYSGDNGPATIAEFSFPDSVVVDGVGNLYIADSGNYAIRKVAPNGTITTIAGGTRGYFGDNGPAVNAGLDYAGGIAVGPDGTLYIPDTYNNAVRALTPCIQSLSPTASADSTAQVLTVPLTAVPACSWSATDLPSWITNASSGTGSAPLQLTLTANTTGVDRSATISVNGLPVLVTQDFTVEQFQDVQPGVYYFDAVDLLKATGVTSGCTATDYCPTANVTRAQMAVFIVRAIIGSDNFTYSHTPYFTDVQPTDFGFAWIQKLDELGITTGCAPNLYCPTDSVTRAQMAVFIIRARYGAATVVDYPLTPYFTDVPNTAFAFNYIQRMKEDNITSGCSATDYCPTNPVTRGDMAIFLMRGAFNQLLPPTEALILSVSPATIANGTTATLTVTGSLTNFVDGSTVVNAVAGLTVNSVSVASPTTLTVNVTASTTATPQPLSIWVTDPTEEAVLPNGLVVQ